jgi:hypothetical protein
MILPQIHADSSVLPWMKDGAYMEYQSLFLSGKKVYFHFELNAVHVSGHTADVVFKVIPNGTNLYGYLLTSQTLFFPKWAGLSVWWAGPNSNVPREEASRIIYLRCHAWTQQDL